MYMYMYLCPMQTLMVQVWYPMTVCTNSRAQKEIIAKVQYMYTEKPFYHVHLEKKIASVVSVYRNGCFTLMTVHCSG